MWYRFLVFNVVLLNIFRTFAAENNPNSREVVIHKYENSDELLIANYIPCLKNLQGNPTVIFLNGGAFQHVEIDKSKPFLSVLADNGFNVFSLKYRTGWLETKNSTDICAGKPEDLAGIIIKELEDVYYMMEFLHKNAGEFNINPENTFIIGGSSGAVIGLTYTYNADYFVKWALENQCQLEDPELYISLLQSRKAPKAIIALAGFLLEPDRIHSTNIVTGKQNNLQDRKSTRLNSSH